MLPKWTKKSRPLHKWNPRAGKFYSYRPREVENWNLSNIFCLILPYSMIWELAEILRILCP